MNPKHHVDVNIQTLPQYLVEAPLAKVTASSRLGFDDNCHIPGLGDRPTPQEILSASVRLDRDCQGTDIFRSL